MRDLRNLYNVIFGYPKFTCNPPKTNLGVVVLAQKGIVDIVGVGFKSQVEAIILATHSP